MAQLTRLRAVLPKPGAVSRFNDNTMEYVIAAARVLTALGVLGVLAGAVGYIWTLDGRWAFTDLLAALVTVASGWFGFWANGNEGWRNGDTK